jgi:hypothetical protein
MPTRFFKIEALPVFNGDWGDYGRILQHGMTSRLSREEGLLALERTGPFIPPITLPGIGDIVLTSAARESLEASGLRGFDFRPVRKVLIVELHWENWDLAAKEPQQFPDTGEPEDYILGQPNSPTASAELGELWEVVVPATATVLRPQRIVYSYKELKLDINTWNGSDLIRSTGYGSILFTQVARDWFTENWGEYVEFLEFPTTESST